MLKVRVAAAAADGAANAAVLALLAKALHVPKSSLTLVAGQTARLKRVAVEGLDAAQFLKAAEDAKAGCPVSKALTGVDITLDAQLEA